MPFDKMDRALSARIAELETAGTRKAPESVIVERLPTLRERGPRLRLKGETKPFLRMNSNSYLGLSTHPEVIAASERATQAFGVGPQAVRFISGTHEPHVELERELARFHGRPAAMIYSSAYAAILGVLSPLIDTETLIASDALNHNSIINAIRLARPAHKSVYPHLDLSSLERVLEEGASLYPKAIVVTDGVFSMRGDHAPLDRIARLAERYHDRFPEGVVTVVDDSHGVGALGARGRGSEEHTDGRADLLIATLGKAFGVNGGYVVGSATLVAFLRERSPFYIYSNPIGPGEAEAARRALAIVDSAAGRERIGRLRAVTRRFRDGLVSLGFETVTGEHPVVPLLVRDTPRTHALTAHLYHCGVLATGLTFPVVPAGEEEIRFQLSAEHTDADIDEALEALSSF